MEWKFKEFVVVTDEGEEILTDESLVGIWKKYRELKESDKRLGMAGACTYTIERRYVDEEKAEEAYMEVKVYRRGNKIFWKKI